VKKPLAVAIGDNDKVLPLKQAHEIEAALKVISGLKSELVYYPGAGHGFAVRADPGNEKQSQQAKVAENQAVKFFSEAFQDVKH
jgi:dipeptidyl aminopeptidase/acylaminoacyl peptidase